MGYEPLLNLESADKRFSERKLMSTTELANLFSKFFSAITRISIFVPYEATLKLIFG